MGRLHRDYTDSMVLNLMTRRNSRGRHDPALTCSRPQAASGRRRAWSLLVVLATERGGPGSGTRTTQELILPLSACIVARSTASALRIPAGSVCKLWLPGLLKKYGDDYKLQAAGQRGKVTNGPASSHAFFFGLPGAREFFCEQEC